MAVTQAATHEASPKAGRRPATGVVVFGGVVALWTAFFVLALASPATLDDAWAWLRGLPLVLELGMWLVALPWALALAVWQSSWADWVQAVLIGAFAIGWTAAFFPRVQK